MDTITANAEPGDWAWARGNGEEKDVDLSGFSSSLSEPDDKDEADMPSANGDAEAAPDAPDGDDSDAETERLYDSPHVLQRQKTIILHANRQSPIPSRSPDIAHANGDSVDAGEQALSDDESSLSEADLPAHEESLPPRKASDIARSTTPPRSNTGLGISHSLLPAENEPILLKYLNGPSNQEQLVVPEMDSKKRKRSIMAGSGLEDGLEEPLRKRTGSVKAASNDFAIEDDPLEDVVDPAKDVIDVLPNDDEPQAPEIEEDDARNNGVDADDDTARNNAPPSPKRKSRRRRRNEDEDAQDESENPMPLEGDAEGDEGDEDAEAANKTEEEMERKRTAFEQLSSIEPLFAAFRERLYDEKLEALAQEEAMLKQSKPTHPEFLAMMKCIDARRDERYRIADKLLELKMETTRVSARAIRSQLLCQYQQDVRAIRETAMEELGKEWYDIQHDRRTFAGTPMDYGFRFPRKRSEQVRQQVAYCNEVSILSGVAKYVGFPAAPPMAQATNQEYAEDIIRMGRVRQRYMSSSDTGLPDVANIQHDHQHSAEWANAQHPSHAGLHRQSSNHHTNRTRSPLPNSHQGRRHTNQLGLGVPISGTFSMQSSLPQTNGAARVSSHQASQNHTHVGAPHESAQTSHAIAGRPDAPSSQQARAAPIRVPHDPYQPSNELPPAGSRGLLTLA